jgi:septal ring factor EnvC (AmiA/AmiB activator)
MVTDLWKKFAKERFSAKLKKDNKSGEWYAEKLNGSISPNEYAIRSSVESAGSSDAALNVWFDLGSTYLNRREDPQGATEAVSALTDFYIEVRTAVINKELKEAESRMKELESDKRKLEKDNDNLHKDIENYKAKIKKAEEDIVRNEQQQNTNVADQESQRRLIEEIKIRLQNVNSERY